MSRFWEKVGVSIASKIGITAAIAMVAAAVLGIGYGWIRSHGPRDTVKAESGSKVYVEDLCFYRKGTKITGKVYRPAQNLEKALPAVIYCQGMSYGDGWCRSIASAGTVCYAFDFEMEGERNRTAELETVLESIRELRYVDKGKVFLLGEGNGCPTAATVTFSHPRHVEGLILVSPGFNPLEINRKARKYKGSVLIVDDTLGRSANVSEILDYIH